MKHKNLVIEAIKAKEGAYAPYSNFKVGAALLTDDGRVFTGCNIENASFGATNCAERTAIFKAVSEGAKKIVAIAVIGSDKEYTYPCGICRQVLSEFGSKDMEVLIVKNEEEVIETTLNEILPGTFTKEDLDKNK